MRHGDDDGRDGRERWRGDRGDDGVGDDRARFDADRLFDDPEETGPRTRSVLLDRLPDPRDGLTRVERVVLWQLDLLERERPGRNVPTAMLFGRVAEHVHDLTEAELNDVLVRLGARREAR